MTKSIHGRNIHFNGLRYFYEVASTRSFRRAADVLHIAASAISRQVQILEEELGCSLFERRRGRAGVMLTPAGEILLESVRESMDAVERGCNEIAALHGLRRGHVELGINEGFASVFLTRFLASFSEQHPGVTYEIKVAGSRALIDWLMDDEVELVLAFNPPLRVGVELLSRIDVDTKVMLHKSHPLARKRSIEVSDLAGCDLVMPSSDLVAHRRLNDMFAAKGIKVRSLIVSNSHALMQHAAVEGLGIRVMSSHPVQDTAFGPETVFRPLRDDAIDQEQLICCKRAGRKLSPATKALTGLLIEVLESRSAAASPTRQPSSDDEGSRRPKTDDVQLRAASNTRQRQAAR